MPVDPIQAQPTYATALAAFEKLPRVRVLFDNGAGKGPTHTASAGDPYAAYELGFSKLPIPGTVARSWYLGAPGTLGNAAPGTAGTNSFIANPKAVPPTNHGPNAGGGGLWGNASQWQWNWQQHPAGNAVSYVTAPLKSNNTVIGSGAVELWVKSSVADVDLQATISEVRPDGNETFVQGGWLRASERKLSTDSNNIFKRPSTTLEPIPTFMAKDAAPMPANQYVKVVVPLYYQGHAYRIGSRIRVTIAGPNGAQPVWSFGETQPAGTSNVSIQFSPTMPSSLVLPVVPLVTVPTALPPCPSLRNQPCRPYEPIVNGAAS